MIRPTTLTAQMIFTLDEKKEFFNGFYFLYKSGYPLSEIFKSISSSSKKARVKIFCSYLIWMSEKGTSLKDTLAPYTQTLGYAYSMLISAGEAAGKLEETLFKILEDIKKQEDLKSILISSLTYPVLMLCFAIFSFFFFQFFFFKVFASFSSGAMCPSSLLMLAIRALFKIALIFLAIFGVIFYICKNKILLNNLIDFLTNNTPLGGLLADYSFLTYFSVLSLAYQAGTPIFEALAISANTVLIKRLQNRLKELVEITARGKNLSTAFYESQIFSEYAVSQVSIGEKSGSLDNSFKLIAQDYENKLQNSIKIFSKVLEPVMIVIVGVMVCYIAVNFYKNLYAGILG